MANSSNQAKCAGDRPADSSSSREYRCRKKTWNTRSNDKGPKYRNVVRRRQYYILSAMQFFRVRRNALVMPYLVLDKYRSEAVEQLEWRHNLTLHQRTGQDGGGRPPSSAERHLPEPGLEGESSLSSETTASISHHLLHVSNDAGGSSKSNVQLSGTVAKRRKEEHICLLRVDCSLFT